MDQRSNGIVTSLAGNLGLIGLILMPKCPVCFFTWIGILGLLGIPAAGIVSSFGYLFWGFVTLVILSQLIQFIYFRQVKSPIIALSLLAFLIVCKQVIESPFWFWTCSFVPLVVLTLHFIWKRITQNEPKAQTGNSQDSLYVIN